MGRTETFRSAILPVPPLPAFPVPRSSQYRRFCCFTISNLPVSATAMTAITPA